MNPTDLIGRKYTFEDGHTIEVVQVVDREINESTTPVVTYHTEGPRTIPRKLMLPFHEFIDTYGHLFES